MEMLAHLSDTIARVVISGFSSALLVIPTTPTTRSAAVPVLLFRAESVLQLHQASCKAGQASEGKVKDTYRTLLGKNLVKTTIHVCYRNRMTVCVLARNEEKKRFLLRMREFWM